MSSQNEKKILHSVVSYTSLLIKDGYGNFVVKSDYS